MATMKSLAATPSLSSAKRSLEALKRSTGMVPYAISFIALLVLWHVISVYLVRSILFPSPLIVFVQLTKLIENGTLIDNVGASLQRILSGFLLGTVVAIPIGLAIGSFTIARKLIEPWTEFLRFVPATAMITTAVIWFGIGEGSKIFLSTYATLRSLSLSLTRRRGCPRSPRTKYVRPARWAPPTSRSFIW